jgi:hypothetical protein
MANDIEQIKARVIASATRDKIPTVDPEDLKSLWNLETELEEITAPYKVEGQSFGFWTPSGKF